MALQTKAEQDAVFTTMGVALASRTAPVRVALAQAAALERIATAFERALANEDADGPRIDRLLDQIDDALALGLAKT